MPAYRPIEALTAIVSTALTGLVFGALLERGYLNPASLPAHFMAPVLAGLLLAVVHRRFLSPLAYVLLPLGYALAMPVALSGVLVLNRFLQTDQGQSWISDVLVQYLPCVAASYVVYLCYAWSAGRRSALVALLLAVWGAFIGLCLFSDFSFSLVLMLFLGGSSGLLALMHLGQKDKGSDESSTRNSTPPDTLAQ